MNRRKLFIIKHLADLFYHKKHAVGGTVVNKLKIWTKERRRHKPDWAYVNDLQISLGRKGKAVVPEFIVEIILESEPIFVVQKKIYEYFSIGVKVLWIIHPLLRVVHVYTSTKKITVCEDDDDICSGAPVLPEFEISIHDLFKL